MNAQIPIEDIALPGLADLPWPVNNEGVPPEKPADLTKLSVDALWELRERAVLEQREVGTYKGKIDQELHHRFEAAHPDFGPETGGTVELAGQRVLVKLGYSRNYAWATVPLAMAKAEDLLTAGEFDELIPEWEPKVSGTVFNKLVKRGGRLAELLGQARFLKSSSPSFEAKERV